MNIILNSIKYISPYYEYGTKKQYQKNGETYYYAIAVIL